MFNNAICFLGRFAVGENLYNVEGDGSADWSGSVKNWFDEINALKGDGVKDQKQVDF